MSDEALHLAHQDAANLPDGWAQSTLGQVGDYINGRAFKSSEWTDSGLPIIRIQNLTGSKETVNFFAGELEAKHRVEAGDLLISWAATLGVYKWSGPVAALNQHIFKVRSKLDLGFHYYLARFILAELMSAAHGSGMEHVTKKAFEAVEVPIPPLSEQSRIADRLVRVDEKLDDLEGGVESAAATVRRLRRALLASAVSGRLTADWRSDQTDEDPWKEFPDLPDADEEVQDLPEGWRSIRCGDLVDPSRALTYGVIKLGAAVDGGVPTLRSSNVRHLEIDEAGLKTIDPAISDDYERTILRGGEVLVTVRGSLGGVAVASPEMAGYNVSREVAVIPLQAGVDPNYLALALASPQAQAWLRAVSVGVAYTGINIRDLKRLPITLPSPAEQAEIVRVYEVSSARVDALEDGVRAAGARVAALRNACLAKAFRGELVPTEASLAAVEGRPFEAGEVFLARVGAI